jgi:hypothetical protein
MARSVGDFWFRQANGDDSNVTEADMRTADDATAILCTPPIQGNGVQAHCQREKKATYCQGEERAPQGNIDLVVSGSLLDSLYELRLWVLIIRRRKDGL